MNRGGKGGAKPKCADWRLDPTRFLSWTRLVLLQARVWRVIYNMRSPKERIKRQELLPEEIEDTEEEIISRAQLEAFPEEYMVLLTGKEIPKRSSMSKLSLVGRSKSVAVVIDFNSLNVFRAMLGFPLYCQGVSG